ncbi:Glutamyl-tRNA reductase-binding protein, chloroplastic [Porphyridium purpureum]|uniref:Glutamyl-tRNA reductase-binding protein, chloroplastic n=1 Tax=Porphyridium purpureum TaxID=35688 RepID=A0A5J4Z6S2_PORPP|nr:Glutamyl-tRNA reductase-binding protein, chloroplastic [Porphyridium purpureum]|eukprot:POR3410..scf295_1
MQVQGAELATQNQDQPYRNDNIPHKLTLGERARTVAHVCRTGTLCTASEKHDGHPFGSHVDYILNDAGSPVFLLAKNAAHTRNLRANPLCSLFCQPVSNSGQGGGRCTLVGALKPLDDKEAEELKDTYIYFHPHAEQALSVEGKFQFYHMEVNDIYFVGGFGVSATWVEPGKFTEATPDPLAFDAPGIIALMNREKKEELNTLVRVFIGVDDADQVDIMSLDRLGFDLRVRTGAETKEYRIGFREQVQNRFDVQSALTKTLQEAWEKENGFDDLWEGAEERPVIMYYQSYQSM